MEKKPKRLFDIGCNTAKFETALLKAGFDGQIVLIDLPQQLKKARENLQSANLLNANLEFYHGNVLDENFVFPKNPDSVLMSQFLDCFSKEQIRAILKKVFNAMNSSSHVYILEPFWDKQRFEAAKLSLTHTSLYFASIANGNSKMYKFSDMELCIKEAGLKIIKIHNNIGRHEYSLIECAK
jgi:tRNA A58 N-methylase Trm61